MEQFTRDDVAKLVAAADLLERARVKDQANERPFRVQSVVLDLTTARDRSNAFRIGFPFKSIFLQEATDVLANIQVILGSNDQLQSPFTMKQNSSINSDVPTNEAFVYWPAQANKSVTLLVFTDAKFESGTQISVTSGGVSISDGSTITGPTRVTLSATTATIIAPALSTRKKCTIQNKTGADLYIGGSTIGAVGGATEGIKIPADGIIYWQNTAALYGWSVAGGNIHYIEEA